MTDDFAQELLSEAAALWVESGGSEASFLLLADQEFRARSAAPKNTGVVRFGDEKCPGAAVTARGVPKTRGGPEMAHVSQKPDPSAQER